MFDMQTGPDRFGNVSSRLVSALLFHTQQPFPSFENGTQYLPIPIPIPIQSVQFFQMDALENVQHC